MTFELDADSFYKLPGLSLKVKIIGQSLRSRDYND